LGAGVCHAVAITGCDGKNAMQINDSRILSRPPPGPLWRSVAAQHKVWTIAAKLPGLKDFST
jgi:hypothetical protein